MHEREHYDFFSHLTRILAKRLYNYVGTQWKLFLLFYEKISETI